MFNAQKRFVESLGRVVYIVLNQPGCAMKTRAYDIIGLGWPIVTILLALVFTVHHHCAKHHYCGYYPCTGIGNGVRRSI